MDIALILLVASALIGAVAGLRFKVLVLVPIALLIALVSAAVLRMYGFGAGSGIVTIAACLVLSQTAYLLVQTSPRSSAFDPSFDDVTDGVPSPSPEQAIDGDHSDHGDQKPPAFRPFL